MRHAVVGAGGIGGLVAAALARSGADVELLIRPAALAAYGGLVFVESAVLGDFEVEVRASSEVEDDVDIVWIATKATQLEEALDLVPAERVGEAAVIPLLNGVDHLAVLQARYANVVAGAIRVESERVGPARIRQRSPFLRVELAGSEAAAAELRTAGIECRIRADGPSLLWDKLAFLAPVALATTALDGPLGSVRDDPRYRACQQEVVAVARAEGATIDDEALRAVQASAPDAMRSSMQKDVEAGRQPELDAIAGPILRGGGRHDISVPGTRELARLVGVRTGSIAPG